MGSSSKAKCVALDRGQFNAPTLSHARFDAPFNAQVTPTVAIPTVTAHTHSCADHCCTTAAPYSAPLISATTAALILHHTAHHSSHRPMLHQTLLDQPRLGGVLTLLSEFQIEP